MSFKLLLTSTLPGRHPWQVVLLPTVSVYNEPSHTVVNLEWLFWLVTIMKVRDRSGFYLHKVTDK